MTNWQEIHQDFTSELQKEWEGKEFAYTTCKEWIDIGLSPLEVGLAAWLRDIKSQDIENFTEPQWVKANADLELLREEYKEDLGNKMQVDSENILSNIN